MFAEPPIALLPSLNENEMRRYSDSEVDLLIEDLSLAAYEAIEQAAGEAAKAAFLVSLEREAAANREAANQQAEATRWRLEAENRQQAFAKEKKAMWKRVLYAALIGVLCGLALGIGGTLKIRS
jgi:hypothetical protein